MLIKRLENSEDSSDPCQHSVSSEELRGGDLRRRKSHGPGDFEPLINQYSSSNICHRQTDFQHFTPLPVDTRTERRTSPAPSLSSSSSPVIDDNVVPPTSTGKTLYRRDTASRFEPGRVFEVSRHTSTCTPAITKAGVLGCLLLVVIYRSNSSITCLPLRRHSSISPRNVDFLKSRIRICAGAKESIDPLPGSPWKPLSIDVVSDSEALDDMWINVERPHTIENVQDVEVALWGLLDDDSFEALRKAYLSCQLRNLSNPREKPRFSLLWHFGFIIGCIWAGLLRIVRFSWLDKVCDG